MSTATTKIRMVSRCVPVAVDVNVKANAVDKVDRQLAPPLSFGGLFTNLTVLDKKDQRSLQVAAAVPWFWRNDCQSSPTFLFNF